MRNVLFLAAALGGAYLLYRAATRDLGTTEPAPTPGRSTASDSGGEAYLDMGANGPADVVVGPGPANPKPIVARTVRAAGALKSVVKQITVPGPLARAGYGSGGSYVIGQGGSQVDRSVPLAGIGGRLGGSF